MGDQLNKVWDIYNRKFCVVLKERKMFMFCYVLYFISLYFIVWGSWNLSRKCIGLRRQRVEFGVVREDGNERGIFKGGSWCGGY